MSDQEAQADELLALTSIYDEGIFSDLGSFAAHLELQQPFNVVFSTNGMTDIHSYAFLH